MPKTLSQLSEDILELAKAKRWGVVPNDVNVLEKFALIHSEISEALEAYRNNRFEGKDCLKEEFADMLIRILHLANILNITSELESEIEKKIQANYGRDWSHKNETLAKE